MVGCFSFLAFSFGYTICHFIPTMPFGICLGSITLLVHVIPCMRVDMNKSYLGKCLQNNHTAKDCTNETAKLKKGKGKGRGRKGP